VSIFSNVDLAESPASHRSISERRQPTRRPLIECCFGNSPAFIQRWIVLRWRRAMRATSVVRNIPSNLLDQFCSALLGVIAAVWFSGAGFSAAGVSIGKLS
jgi:hypothetical protein